MNKQRIIKFLTPEQIELLLDGADDKRDDAVLQILVTTGLRVHELAGLPLAPFKGVPDASKTLELAIVGKGGRQRTVFFSPAVLGAVLAYLGTRKGEDPRLFPCTIRTIQNIVSRCGKNVGLDEAWPHLLRHSFASNLLRNGVSLNAVKEFLGHSNIGTTSIYLHTSNRELKDIHEKMFK